MARIFSSFAFLALCFLVLLVPLWAPQYAHAANTPLVQKCSGENESCTFKDVAELIKRLIAFAVFDIAIPISVIAIVWAGINMVLAEGNSSKIEKAKDSLWSILKGLAYIILASLIVLSLVKLLKVKPEFLPDEVNSST